VVEDDLHFFLAGDSQLFLFALVQTAKQLGFDSSQIKSASQLFDGLYRTFVGLDCSMVEVNPLVVTDKGEVLALDALATEWQVSPANSPDTGELSVLKTRSSTLFQSISEVLWAAFIWGSTE